MTRLRIPEWLARVWWIAFLAILAGSVLARVWRWLV